MLSAIFLKKFQTSSSLASGNSGKLTTGLPELSWHVLGFAKIPDRPRGLVNPLRATGYFSLDEPLAIYAFVNVALFNRFPDNSIVERICNSVDV